MLSDGGGGGGRRSGEGWCFRWVVCRLRDRWPGIREIR